MPDPDYADLDRKFQQRFDIARMMLERKHRWAKYTLRNLQPVRSHEHPTMAVDQYLRLYHGDQADNWTDKEFAGALWHEVNHILRHHHDRLSDLPRTMGAKMDHVLWSSDLEINDDMATQGIMLPEGTGLVSEMFDHEPNQSAEAHVILFTEQQREADKPEKGDPDPDADEEDGDDQDSGDGEGSQPDSDPGDNDGDDEGDDGEQGPDGEGEAGSNGEGCPSPGKPDAPQAPDEFEGCGSGSGGEPIPDELPAPDPQEQGDLEKAERKQAEEILEAAEGGLPPGMSADMVDAAVEFLGKTEHDWRRTMATEIRNAMEQRADEAEEYSFRRQSRRAGAVGDDYILPGSYRPVPVLHVYADVSGSMDQNKLTASVREVHGILERLAIPSFVACGWNTRMTSHIDVAGPSDVDRVFEKRGGGTDMQAAVNNGIKEGAEVIVVLTDNETRWDTNGPDGVPVIIGGINRRGGDSNIPAWCRIVDVGEVPILDEVEGEWDY